MKATATVAHRCGHRAKLHDLIRADRSEEYELLGHRIDAGERWGKFHSDAISRDRQMVGKLFFIFFRLDSNAAVRPYG